jgi:hypothetical protein
VRERGNQRGISVIQLLKAQKGSSSNSAEMFSAFIFVLEKKQFV